MHLPPISSSKVAPFKLIQSMDQSKNICVLVTGAAPEGQNAGRATLHGGKGVASRVKGDKYAARGISKCTR